MLPVPPDFRNEHHVAEITTVCGLRNAKGDYHGGVDTNGDAVGL